MGKPSGNLSCLRSHRRIICEAFPYYVADNYDRFVATCHDPWWIRREDSVADLLSDNVNVVVDGESVRGESRDQIV